MSRRRFPCRALYKGAASESESRQNCCEMVVRSDVQLPNTGRRLSYGQNVTALRSAFQQRSASATRSTSPSPPLRAFSTPPPRTLTSSPPPLSPLTLSPVSQPLPLPAPTKSTVNPTMQAIRLQKKYPEVSQEEMFDLINRFKCVYALWLFATTKNRG